MYLCMYVCIYLSIYLFFSFLFYSFLFYSRLFYSILSIYLSISLSLSIYLSISLSLYLSISLSISLSLSIYPSIYLSISSLIAGCGIQFPTDHYNDPVLVLCDFLGGSDMVPWTHLREPFLRWMWTDLTSELTHFNVVIRLSRVKQPAFRLCTFFERPAAPVVLMNFRNVQRCSSGALPNYHKLPFCRSFLQCNMSMRQQACPLPAGMVCLVFGEVKHAVHLIHPNLNSCLMPMWPDRQRSRLRE